MTAEIDKPSDKASREIMRSFSDAVLFVQYNAGGTRELLTKADDTVSGLKNTYSPSLGPVEGGDKLEKCLEVIIKDLVPEGESKATLEKGFEESKKRIKKGDHGDTYVSEWQTIHDNVVIGIKVIRDQRGESVRTWYLRNTDKKKFLKTLFRR